MDQTNQKTILIELDTVAQLLKEHDNILILTHHYPDGDTLGCGFALHQILNKMGKTSRVINSHTIPDRYSFLLPSFMPEFEEEFICSVDTADGKLLGSKFSKYADKVDLCIDHHPSNIGYAKYTCLKPDYAAAAMIIFELTKKLEIEIDPYMANCLYTGTSTDTGCFRFLNTSAYALRMAADLIDLGAEHHKINKLMFNTKTRERIALEGLVLEEIRFHFKDRCAVITITKDMVKKTGASENDMEGLTSLPREVESVWVGVTFRERKDGSFKVSVRTGDRADASEICSLLGGGGHKYASGCLLKEPFKEAEKLLLDAIVAKAPNILE